MTIDATIGVAINTGLTVYNGLSCNLLQIGSKVINATTYSDGLSVDELYATNVAATKHLSGDVAVNQETSNALFSMARSHAASV